MALFAGVAGPVFYMATLLEMAKVTMATMLHNNWRTYGFIKYYLSFAVVILMIMTSMGVYGLLSKGHIEQQIHLNGSAAQRLPVLEVEIKVTKERIDDYGNQIKQIDEAVSRMVAEGKASRSLAASKEQANKRKGLAKEKASQEAIRLEQLKEQGIVQAEVNKLNAEIGPLKYVAQLIYGQNASQEQTETAVRLMMLMIVCVFDPVAMGLIVLTLSGLNAWWKTPKKIVQKPPRIKAEKPAVPAPVENTLDDIFTNTTAPIVAEDAKAEVIVAPVAPEPPGPPKKKRGRPPGVPNKPKLPAPKKSGGLVTSSPLGQVSGAKRTDVIEVEISKIKEM